MQKENLSAKPAGDLRQPGFTVTARGGNGANPDLIIDPEVIEQAGGGFFGNSVDSLSRVSVKSNATMKTGILAMSNAVMDLMSAD